MGYAQKRPTLKETRALLRAMSKLIQRAENLGEDELVDVIAVFQTNIARRASLQRDRERLRAQITRRYQRRSNATGLVKKSQRGGHPGLYLVKDTSPDK